MQTSTGIFNIGAPDRIGFEEKATIFNWKTTSGRNAVKTDSKEWWKVRAALIAVSIVGASLAWLHAVEQVAMPQK